MTIEDQVVSLELSKKLKELGIKQESVFWWSVCHDCIAEYSRKNIKVEWEISYDKRHGEHVSAFTVSELMEMLPAIIDTEKDEPFNNYWLSIHKRIMPNIRYIAAYYCDTTYAIMSGFTQLFSCHDERLPDCLAKTLIHCIENGWIKGEKK